MKFTLNDTLKEVPADMSRNRHKTSKEDFAKTIMRTLDDLPEKEYKFIGGYLNENAEVFTKGFVKTLSNSYSDHRKIQIAPQDLWYIVLCEIAKIINKNSEKCRPLFTSSDYKIDIKIPTDDPSTLDLNLIIENLKHLVPTDIDVFIPTLSTETVNSKTAFYAAFADAVKSYYSYSTFMCGIPEIEILGTMEDWGLVLGQNCVKISQMFFDLGLVKEAKYIHIVSNIFYDIAATLADEEPQEVDIAFYKDIFTSKNIGSGGELIIDGWITKLFFEQPTMKKLENFLSSISTVPYKNLDTGRQFIAVYGAFEQHKLDNEYIKSDFSSIIYEIVDRK